MLAFQLGGSNHTRAEFEKTIAIETEKLVSFFGENFRAQITDKINSTIFVIVDRIANFRSANLEREKQLVQGFIDQEFGTAYKYMDIDYPIGYNLLTDFIVTFKWLLKQDHPLQAISENKVMLPFLVSYLMKNQDFSKLRSLQLKIFKKNFSTQELRKILLENFDDNSLKSLLQRIYQNYTNSIAAEYEILQQSNANNYYNDIAFSLTEEEVMTRCILGEVFSLGRLREIEINTPNHEEDISAIFIKFVNCLRSRQILDANTKSQFENMLFLLTGKKLRYEQYFTPEIINLIEVAIDKYTTEKQAMQENNQGDKILHTPIGEFYKFITENFCMGKDEVEMQDLGRFITHALNWGAYMQPIRSKSTGEWISIVVVPADCYGLTHELVHTISTSSSTGMSGIEYSQNDTALNEFITELLALLTNKMDINDYSVLNSYMSALPIIGEFVLAQIKQIKTLYLNNDMNALQELFGDVELSRLCKDMSLVFEHKISVFDLKNALNYERIPFTETDLNNPDLQARRLALTSHLAYSLVDDIQDVKRYYYRKLLFGAKKDD